MPADFGLLHSGSIFRVIHVHSTVDDGTLVNLIGAKVFIKAVDEKRQNKKNLSRHGLLTHSPTKKRELFILD